jgi:hypothetical protein
MWRPDVRVIEQLAGRSEKIEPERALKRASEQWYMMTAASALSVGISTGCL